MKLNTRLTEMYLLPRVSANATLPSAITVKEEAINRQDPSRLSQPSTSSERQRSDSQDSKPDQSFLPHHPKPIAVNTKLIFFSLIDLKKLFLALPIAYFYFTKSKDVML